MNTSNNSIIVNVVYVVEIGASINNRSNAARILNVVYVVKIGTCVHYTAHSAMIIDIIDVVRTFLGLFFSFNEEVLGTWFPRDLGVQGEEEADCQGKECYLKRAH